MLNFFTDTISNGTRVKSAVNIDNGYVQFDDDPTIPLPLGHQGYYISTAHFDGYDWCLAKGNPNASPSYLVNRQTRNIQELPKSYGESSVWLTDSGLVCYCPDNDHYIINGQTTEAHVGSQGFTQVENDGKVIIRADNREIFRKGYKLGLWRSSGEWEAGISEDHLIVAYNTRTTKLYRVAQVQTPVAIKITQLADFSCVVSISRPFDFKTHFVDSDTFVEIDTKIIISAKYARKMLCCPYDQYSGYGTTRESIGNCAFPWKDKFPLVPGNVSLMMAFDTYNPAYINKTLYYYIHSQNLNDNTTKEQIEFFRDKPVKPFILYGDFRNWPATLPAWLDEYRNRLFIGAQVYPKQTEDVLKFKNEMIGMFEVLKTYKLPIVASLAFYNVIPIDRLICNFTTYDYLIKEYYVIGIMPFADTRPGGMDSNPILYSYLQEFYSAIPAGLNRYDGWYEDDNSLIAKLRYEMPMFTPFERAKLIDLVASNGL